MPLSTPDKPPAASAQTVAIEKLVYGGEGLARIDGQVLLVPFVLPGERVRVTPDRVKTGLLRSASADIEQPSSERVIPRCEYFGTCGGCQYQHSQYPFQLKQKELILRETLQRLGGVAYESDIAVISEEPWHYRNRIQLHFDKNRTGFHKRASRELCAIDHCYISSPRLLDAIGRLNEAAKSPNCPSFLRSLELFTNEDQLQMTLVDTNRPVAARFFDWCASFLPGFAPGAIDYRAAGHIFRISRGSFFQVNRFLVDALVGEAIGDQRGNHAIDLYAGVGLFSLALAQRFERTEAVERSGPAYRDLEFNAQATTNLRTTKAAAEEFLRTLDSRPDLIIADPPHTGLGRDATAELLRILPERLTLVSCDPATLSRDIRKLLVAYRIARLTLIDLFPHTYHFETIVHLVRN
jgi:23S rRNA (uracil1939-C5)-methyltransferase